MKVIGYIATVLASVWQRMAGETKHIANTYNAPNAGVVSSGIKSYRADAAITRYHLVKAGSDSQHVAVSAGATDVIRGVALDQAEAAEDPIAVFVLGAAAGTVLVVAAAAISEGALVQSNGDGTVKTAVSTGYPIGRALQAAQAAGDVIEIAPMLSEHAVA